MNIYNYKKLNELDLEELCSRAQILDSKTIQVAQAIIEDIRHNGDPALLKYIAEFDHSHLESSLISLAQLENAEIDSSLEISIKKARRNIEYFHKNQKLVEDRVEIENSLTCWREFRPIDSVGLYIPGGTAPLFSTVLMLVIPALIAQCPRIVVCSPPPIAPEILWTLKLLGIRELHQAGGAHAIAALAYGTSELRPVAKIFGPGNKFVMAAKMLVAKHVAIDMPAGPSEILIICDESADLRFIVADLLAQAEHGGDSQLVLLSTSKAILAKLNVEINSQLAGLERKEIAQEALEHGLAILVPDLDSALAFANRYAPEHLLLAFADYRAYLPQIKNAGSVFCGPLSSESFGDYASGTNHTLATGGFARSFSGLDVQSFGKWISFQELGLEALESLGPHVENMAGKEGLTAHKNAVAIRRKAIIS